MKLRWLIRKYPKASIAEIKSLMEATGKGKFWCKNHLNKRDEKVLQIYVQNGTKREFSHLYGDYYNAPKYEWVDIPVVEEFVDEHSNNLQTR